MSSILAPLFGSPLTYWDSHHMQAGW